MKITYIHQHYALPEEGGGMRPWEFSRRLAKAGHEVTVIGGGQKNETITREGITIIRVKSPYGNDMSKGQRIASFLSFMARSTLRAAITKADVVFASSTPLTVAVPGIIASLPPRRRFVFEVRDLWPHVPIELGYITSKPMIFATRLLEKITYLRADHVIALSPGMGEGVVDVAPKTKVTIIPNASDRELFAIDDTTRATIRERLGWTDDRPSIVYIGSFGDGYRIPWIVRLAAALPECDIKIFGAGMATTQARALAEELGMDADTLLPGKIAREEVAGVLASADISISSILEHPALHPNSFNKVFDSLAAGRPLIFNHDGWLSDLCTSRGAGWRLSSDIDTAAAQMRDILANPAAVAQAGEVAAELSKDFDREKLFARFERVLTGAEDN